MPSIIGLPGIIAGLKEDEKELFSRFFLVGSTKGKLVLPEEMKPWAEKAFGSIAGVEKQSIIKVFNKLTFEASLFNELRSKRPMEIKLDQDSLKAITDSKNDPFCRPLAGTPEDSFGRIKGKHCVSASNVAKYDGLHGLVVFKKHNPLEFSEKELQDYFKVSMKWFGKAYKSNNLAIYPFLLWNCLWRSGASIIHGHMQLALGEGSHYAEAELYNKVRNDYSESFKSDYFLDLFRLHQLIGLGLECRKVKVFCSITPKKDKEITLISQKFDKAMAKAVYKAAACLVRDLGVNSFNLGIIMPPLEKLSEWEGFPFIARIVSRGALDSKTSDIGGMEMFSGSKVIETDPYIVFERIKSCF